MEEATRDAVRQALGVVRSRIQQVRQRGRGIGEQNTKATLIEPLLAALGWDLEDIDEVTREYRRKPQDNPVDYALFLLGVPRMFVEAKEIGANLEDRKSVAQILGYATVVGVEWCVLTNGDEYRIYNAHAPVDVEEKLFRTACVSDTGQEQATADTLVLLSKQQMEENLIGLLWRSQFIDRQVKAALEGFLDDHERLTRLLRRDLPNLQPKDIRSALERATIEVQFPPVSGAPRQPIAPVKPRAKPDPATPRSYNVDLTHLISSGLIMPPLALQRRYRGELLEAVVEPDGRVCFDGERYRSLSTAAGMARRSVIGSPPDRRYPQTNGWTFWKFLNNESGKLEEIDYLRQRYLHSHR